MGARVDIALSMIDSLICQLDPMLSSPFLALFRLEAENMVTGGDDFAFARFHRSWQSSDVTSHGLMFSQDQLSMSKPAPPREEQCTEGGGRHFELPYTFPSSNCIYLFTLLFSFCSPSGCLSSSYLACEFLSLFRFFLSTSVDVLAVRCSPTSRVQPSQPTSTVSCNPPDLIFTHTCLININVLS